MKLNKKELIKYLAEGYSLRQIEQGLEYLEANRNEILINKISLTFHSGSIEVSSSSECLDKIKKTTLELMKNIKPNNRIGNYFG